MLSELVDIVTDYSNCTANQVSSFTDKALLKLTSPSNSSRLEINPWNSNKNHNQPITVQLTYGLEHLIPSPIYLKADSNGVVNKKLSKVLKINFEGCSEQPKLVNDSLAIYYLNQVEFISVEVLAYFSNLASDFSFCLSRRLWISSTKDGNQTKIEGIQIEAQKTLKVLNSAKETQGFFVVVEMTSLLRASKQVVLRQFKPKLQALYFGDPTDLQLITRIDFMIPCNCVSIQITKNFIQATITAPLLTA